MTYQINILNELDKSITLYDKRVRDESLDYSGIPAGDGINLIHSYPAMFHPRLVSLLINKYSKINEHILDPFMGSGVAAVESIILGRNFTGYDINPLAVMIAKVRSTPIDIDLVQKSLFFILDKYKYSKSENPNFMNIDYWFTEERIESISKILKAIYLLENEDIKRFFQVALSSTIRAVSRTSPGEFKLVRRKKPCHKSTISVFKDFSVKYISALKKFNQENRIVHKVVLKQKNILTDEIPINDESLSLIITSPPYGDSQTTVAYGQFTRLSLQWLGLPYQIDKISLGAKPIPIKDGIPSQSLYRILNIIEEKDVKRANHVYSFYYDLYNCIKKIVPKVRKKGHVIFVVGNRTVKETQLPTDIICAEIFGSFGFSHLETRVRQIGNKRLPSENSPTNIPGKKASTMRFEYIIIFRRDI